MCRAIRWAAGAARRCSSWFGVARNRSFRRTCASWRESLTELTTGAASCLNGIQKQPIVVWHEHSVSREDREKLNGHHGCVVWFTGLSGCGKSTIANVVDKMLL